MKQVRVKVKDSGAVKVMEEGAALRLIQTHPNGEYAILEPPRVEVVNLPPLEPQKKSVAVAEDKQVLIAEPPKPEPAPEPAPKRMGRPPKQK